MRAVFLKGFGGYEQLEYRTDVPVPSPGPGEVLIRVGACGINNTDIWTREGAYSQDAPSGWQGSALEFPRIQGADIVGQIVEAGPGVSAERIGKRVMVNPTLYGASGDGLYDATFIGSERDGGFAEFACVPDGNALEVDSALADAELATVMVASLTAHHMLNRAEVAPGETVLITGASGGVGSALVQLAGLRGARVVAVVSKEKEPAMRELGVAAVIHRNQQDLVGELQRQLGSQSVDVIADVVAGTQVSRLIESLRPGGRYVTAGAIAGAQVTLDWRKLYLKHLVLLGATMGTRAEAREIVHYVTQGRLKPLLAGVYPLEQLIQAQKAFKRKEFFGKLVIVP